MKKALILLIACFWLIFSSTAVQAQNKCTASGLMGGEKFTAKHCEAASLYDDVTGHSVTIWFNESPITAAEKENFQMSAYASSIKDGKQRTMILSAFCPGGGDAKASPESIKSVQMDISHAKSPMVGRTWVLKAPKDIKIDKMAGDIKPGGNLSGKITLNRVSDGLTYSIVLEFDLKLPEKSAASGLVCK